LLRRVSTHNADQRRPAEQSTGRKKPDILLSGDVTGMYVYRFPTGGASLNGGTSAYINEIKRSTKAR
jgi:hypothetical protein